MDSYDSELAHEQSVVSTIYTALDRLREHYRLEQRRVEQTGAWGSPQARTERDAFAAHYGDQAARLEQVEDHLVFGRLDISDDSHARYIGRIGLRDDNDIQLLIDWRAPASLPFYQATALNSMDVVRRRHLSTRLREVTGIEDELLDIDAAQQEGPNLQGEGALIAALAKARDNRMTDIVATIQAEQDRVIRSTSEGLLVVQGGPGTGKTAVALHRAAFLLYDQHERLAKSGVLIVGPSRQFLRYIEQVLPALGETGVVSLTLGDLLPGIRATEHDSRLAAEVKGRLDWVKIAQNAVHGLQRIPAAPQELQIGSTTLTLWPSDVREAMRRANQSGGTHNQGWEIFALRLLDLLTNQYAGPNTDPEDRPWMREEIRSNIDVRRAINLCWMPSTPQTLLEKLYFRPALLAKYAPSLSVTELEELSRPKGSPWTIEDIPILDELAELLGPHQAAKTRRATELAQRRSAEELARAQVAIESQDLGGGLVDAATLADRASEVASISSVAEEAGNDRTWTYGHIVVDEAQELSPMAWRILLRRCPSRSFTVVGDLAQHSGNYRPTSWKEALGPAARALSEEAVLTISYRTPRTIMSLAEDVLAAAGHPAPYLTQPVRDVEECLAITPIKNTSKLVDVLAEETYRLDQALGGKHGRIAVITPQSVTQDIRLLLELTDSNGFESRISVLNAIEAKGLEFDSVILHEPSSILEEGPGDLYVAMTRCTRRLNVTHTKTLPAGFSADLPE